VPGRGVADDWQLLQFIERLDEWAAREDPSEDLRVIVANWVINLHSNPYADLKPQRGFPDLWFSGIPETSDGHTLVTCTARINPIERTVTCRIIATLGLPLDLDPDLLVDPDEPIE
jgi:hypothetical protein